MRFRMLRIAFSITCLIACVLLIVLWVRSYWVHDSIYKRNGNSVYTNLGSNYGTVYLTDFGLKSSDGLPVPPLGWKRQTEVAFATRSVFELTLSPRKSVKVPYPSLVLIIAAVAVLPWVRWRFTVRTLLIAMTLVAVVLGLIVAVLRWPAG